MKVVYMAHPYSGSAANLARARVWYEHFMRTYDVAIIADWIITSEVLNDADPEDRARGIVADLTLIKLCDEVWLCGPNVSPGMRAEAEAACTAGVTVRDFTGVDIRDGYIPERKLPTYDREHPPWWSKEPTQ